jgi:hypothetical protein
MSSQGQAKDTNDHKLIFKKTNIPINLKKGIKIKTKMKKNLEPPPWPNHPKMALKKI